MVSETEENTSTLCFQEGRDKCWEERGEGGMGVAGEQIGEEGGGSEVVRKW